MAASNGIHRIDTDFYGRTNSLYLLDGEDSTVLIDTGVGSTPGEYLAPYLREHAPNATIDVVLNTHADLDHVGGNRAVAEMFPDSIQMCHELDRGWIDNFDRLIDERYDEYAELGMAEAPETKDFLRSICGSKTTDSALSGGETLTLGPDWSVEVLHAPGHSHGHISVWDARSRTLIIGDAVLSDGLYMTDGSPAFPPTYRYVDDYVATIDHFISIAPDHLLSSHYPSMSGSDAMAFLTGSRDYVDRTDAAVRAAFAAATGPMSLRALIEATAASLGPWAPDAALSLKYPLLGHVERLVESGDVVRVDVDGTPCFIEAARG